MQLALAIVIAAATFISFALKRAALGVDFTDEGYYVVTARELAHGAIPFSSDFMTIWQPFSIVSQLSFRLLGSPNLYQLRLCGWGLHIAAYLLLMFTLFKRTGAVWIPMAASSASLFISFAAPSATATPGYNGLSSDFLLLFLCNYLLADCYGEAARKCLQWAAGLMLLLATVCYPTLIVVVALLAAYEGTNVVMRRSRILHALFAEMRATSGFALGASLLLAYVWATGGLGFWWARFQRIRLDVPSNFAPQISASFVLHLFTDMFTARSEFQSFALVAIAIVVGVGVARLCRFSGRFVEWVLFGFGFYALYLVLHFFGSDSPVEQFFFPTAFCVATTCLLGVFFAAQVTEGFSINGKENVCLGLSAAACIVFATSTHYFSYYYSWNGGLRALPFTFSLLITVVLSPKTAMRRWTSLVGLLCLLRVAYVSGEYNYLSVKRESEVTELRFPFAAPALKGILSSKERVEAIDALCAFMKQHGSGEKSVVAFNDCPLIYFILGVKPAYGTCWARVEATSIATQEWLVSDMLSRPLPQFALRTIVNLSAPDWQNGPKEIYGSRYPLNEAIERYYSLRTTIYPFEVFELTKEPHSKGFKGSGVP